MHPTLLNLFYSELFGTAIMVVLGCGVVATADLAHSKGKGAGWMMISWGWGLAVASGVYVAYQSGGHLNPAVTIARAIAGDTLAEGVPATIGNILLYIVAQCIGAFIGAFVCWLCFKSQFDSPDSEAGTKLGVFCTRPATRSKLQSFFIEATTTFILVSIVLVLGKTPSQIGPVGIGLIIVGIVTSMGGQTGCAINPARDLMPRLMHQLLPIKGKGSSEWSYAWVPILGPICGAAASALAYTLYFQAAL